MSAFATLNQAVLVLVLRIGLVVLLYLFLAVVVVAVRRDLARAAAAAPAGGAARQATRPLAAASLVVVNPGPTQLAPGYRFAVRNPTLIGRGTTNDINLDDEFVSNHHARLMQIDRTWHLEDLGSTNGTWVRGTRLHGTSPLKPGDLLTIGRVDLRLDESPTTPVT